MTTVTLELENCFLVTRSSDPSYMTMVGGSPIRRKCTRWFQEIEFLASLPASNWSDVVKFVEDNKEELIDAYDVYSDYVDALLLTSGTALNKPVLVTRHLPAGYPSSRNTVLFTVVQASITKPYFEFDGITADPVLPISGRSRPVLVDVYQSELSMMMSEGAAGTPPPPSTASFSEVMNYTYKPEYKYMTMPKEKTECFFGLELEVNSEIPWNDIYRTMVNVAPVQEAFIFAKSDASISGEFSKCYEIVSHPMSPRRMRIEFSTLFKKLERLVNEKGLEWGRVFDMQTTSTGIHIHVSKGSFTPLSRTHQKKFMMLWNNSSPAISAFTAQLACRTLKGSHYMSPASDYEGRSLAWMLSKGKNSHRHASCNETPKTVEVRVYRGQPCFASVRHAIDTTEAMLKFTEQMPNSQLNRHFPAHFKAWLGKQNKNSYRSLKETLRHKA